MTLALRDIAVGRRAGPVPSEAAAESHGVTRASARMYARFFGQTGVRLCALDHGAMLADVLRDLVARHPDLPGLAGTGLYAKTQTHNTPADRAWLRAAFEAAGLDGWDLATLSMTNCASGLAALHLLADGTGPVIVLTGEKAFHPMTARLSVGLLGEAPVATLLRPGAGGRRVTGSHVRHLGRYHVNPDDMDAGDRRALQTEFETGLVAFLSEARAVLDPDGDALWLPYNLNPPLIARAAAAVGLSDRLRPVAEPATGHLFCSDVFVTLAAAPLPADRPVIAFCAGMGVTFAALRLAPAAPSSTHPKGLNR